MTPTRTGKHDFGRLHAAMRRQVDDKIFAGQSSAQLVGQELVDQHCVGWADIEQGIALRPDTLFRVFSNTKLITACAALLLFDEGRFQLDDPIERFIPQLADRRVLRPGATRIDDTEPARSPITIRQLMTHSAGLSYGLLDPGTTIYQAYKDRKVIDPATTLAHMIDQLAELPLVFHPGTAWEYSVAIDVLSRLVEVVSGQPFDAFIGARILGPLGMADTGFVVPEAQRHRLAAYYVGADMADPMKPGLRRDDRAPYPGAYLAPVARLSGGGGLVSSLPDMLALLRSLMPGGPALLKPETIALLMSNQLPDGVRIRSLDRLPVPGMGHGLAGAVTLQPSALDPPASTGELHWGGIAGTHWWISPRTGIAGVLMTQRAFGFWHPCAFECKRLMYEAVGATRAAPA